MLGLVAVYLASEAGKKVDRQSEEFLNKHLKIINDRIGDNAEAIKGLQARMHAVEKDVQTVKTFQKQVVQEIANQGEEIKGLRLDFSVLEQSTSPQ